jgi:hypothetical protein
LRLAVVRSEKLLVEAGIRFGNPEEGKVHRWKPLSSNG